MELYNTRSSASGSFMWQSVSEVHPCCSMYHYFIPLYWQVIFYCVDIPPFVYLFIHWWKFKLFPFLEWCCEWCYYDHLYISYCVCTYVFVSLEQITTSGMARSYSKYMLNFLRNLQTVFHSNCTILRPTSNIGRCRFLFSLISTCYYLPFWL